jgi:hypothetical protein
MLAPRFSVGKPCKSILRSPVDVFGTYSWRKEQRPFHNLAQAPNAISKSKAAELVCSAACCVTRRLIQRL